MGNECRQLVVGVLGGAGGTRKSRAISQVCRTTHGVFSVPAYIHSGGTVRKTEERPFELGVHTDTGSEKKAGSERAAGAVAAAVAAAGEPSGEQECTHQLAQQSLPDPDAAQRLCAPQGKAVS